MQISSMHAAPPQKDASNTSGINASLNPHDYETFYDHAYDQAGYHDDQSLSHERPYVARYVELAKREPEKLHTVIVLGCSHGLGAMLLHQDGLLAWGIDIAHKAISMANQLRGRTCGEGSEPCFVQGNLLHLPYGDSTFDAGMSVDVLEHIAPEDVPTVVNEFSRVVEHYLLLHPAGLPEFSKTGEKLGTENVHLTVKPYSWWAEQFGKQGWQWIERDTKPGMLLVRETRTGA